jgi:hypothetical protein
MAGPRAGLAFAGATGGCIESARGNKPEAAGAALARAADAAKADRLVSGTTGEFALAAAATEPGAAAVVAAPATPRGGALASSGTAGGVDEAG